jgi:hypothetical protein
MHARTRISPSCDPRRMPSPAGTQQDILVLRQMECWAAPLFSVDAWWRRTCLPSFCVKRASQQLLWASDIPGLSNLHQAAHCMHAKHAATTILSNQATTAPQYVHASQAPASSLGQGEHGNQGRGTSSSSLHGLQPARLIALSTSDALTNFTPSRTRRWHAGWFNNTVPASALVKARHDGFLP